MTEQKQSKAVVLQHPAAYLDTASFNASEFISQTFINKSFNILYKTLLYD